jgi:radical SAM/Cys-rich protein
MQFDVRKRDAMSLLKAKNLNLPDHNAEPKSVSSLVSRDNILAEPEHQIKALNKLKVSNQVEPFSFHRDLQSAGWETLTVSPIEFLQINMGKLCNMTCRHCHVDAGPDRTKENMTRETVDACLRALDLCDAQTVDLTGGAPELSPHFKYLVDQVVSRGKRVIDRCNLTVLNLPRNRELPEWLASRGVEIVCSLPHYRKLNTDAQRGSGAYEQSLIALKRLNEVGYGLNDPSKRLALVTNPAGAFLPNQQDSLEREWKEALLKNHNIHFDQLYALANMPISRFLEWLLESGNLQGYMERLVQAFNPSTIAGLMCRNTLSISWDGRIYDCDFNQMLELDVQFEDKTGMTVFDFDLQKLQQRSVVTARHCYGCTAGSGSSCGGSIT